MAFFISSRFLRRLHAAEKDKLDIVRSLRLPMVEVSIPKSILYEYDEETTTDEHEAAYVGRIKKMLEGSTGFLACEVLNNPSTLEYMEQQLPMLRQQLTESETARAAAEDRVQELATSVARHEEHARALTRRVVEANEKASRFEESMNDAKSKASQLRNELAVRSAALKELQGQQNDWNIDGRLALAAFAGFAFFIVLIQYFRH